MHNEHMFTYVVWKNPKFQSLTNFIKITCLQQKQLLQLMGYYKNTFPESFFVGKLVSIEHTESPKFLTVSMVDINSIRLNITRQQDIL